MALLRTSILLDITGLPILFTSVGLAVGFSNSLIYLFFGLNLTAEITVWSMSELRPDGEFD